MARGSLLRAELNVNGVLGTQGQLLRAELSAPNNGVLLRAEMSTTDAAAGRLLRAELDSVTNVAGELLRAELSSTAFADGRLLRAELSSANVPVSGGPVSVTVEPFTTITLQGTGGNPNPSTVGWSQTGGPAVVLVGSGDSRTVFVPGSAAGSTLTFMYSVDGATAEVSRVVLSATEMDVVSRVRRPVRPQG